MIPASDAFSAYLEQTVWRAFTAGILRHQVVIVWKKTRLTRAGIFPVSRCAESTLRVVVVFLRHHPLLPFHLLGLQGLDLGCSHLVQVSPQLRDFKIGLLKLPLVPEVVIRLLNSANL